MRKLILLLVIVSLMASFGVISVIAGDQNATVTVNGTTEIVINPTTINFGSVIQGSINNPAINGPITLDAAAGANTNMTIEVTNVVGMPFDTGLKFGGALAKTQTFALNCVVVSGICTYTQVSIIPTLDIPAGFATSVANGVITYTVTGIAP